MNKSINELLSLCSNLHIDTNLPIVKVVQLLSKKALMPPSSVIQDIMTELKNKGFELSDKSGYQFIGDEKPVYEPNLLLRGTVPYLIYFRDHLDDIYDTTKDISTFVDNNHIKPYWAHQLRMSLQRIPKEKLKKELQEKIDLRTKQHYKIHLQPKIEHLKETILELGRLFSTEEYPISVWKFSNYTPQELLESFPANTPPSIVVYPLDSQAQKVVDDILKITNPNWGSGIRPRGNKRINDLIFYAGGDWDVKEQYPELFTADLSMYKGQIPLVSPPKASSKRKSPPMKKEYQTRSRAKQEGTKIDFSRDNLAK